MKRPGALLVLVAVLSLASLPGSAFADAPTAPELSFVSGENVSFKVAGDKASGHLLLQNAGLSSTQVDFRLVLDDGSVKPVSPQSQSVGQGEVVSVTLSIPISRHDERTGRLIADAIAGPAEPPVLDDPAVVGVVIERSANNILVALPVIAGLIASLLLILGCRLVIRQAGGKEKYPWKHYLPTANGKWSFSESWASNITALGAVLGTVLGATGYITEAFANYSVGQFVGLNLLFGALVLLAPVVYLALRRARREGDEEVIYGTYGGLLAASFLTSWAVMGELATVLTLLGAANLRLEAVAGFFLLFVLAFFSIVAYVYQHIKWLAAGVLESPSAPEGAAATQEGAPAARPARRLAGIP